MKNTKIKNYVVLFIILLSTILGTFYFYSWKNLFDKNIEYHSILDNYLSIINYNELNSYLNENQNCIIYVSNNNSKELNKFEQKFVRIIEKHSLNDKILYLNFSLKENKSYVNNMKNEYNIKNLPSILIFQNGKLYNIYNIDINNENTDNLIMYLRVMGVIDD